VINIAIVLTSISLPLRDPNPDDGLVAQILRTIQYQLQYDSGILIHIAPELIIQLCFIFLGQSREYKYNRQVLDINARC
jgi:hypothetical protein